MTSFRRPLGLVLSGGGVLGAWQLAALEVFEKAGLRFDAVMGFSAGALNGATYALGLTREARKHWLSLPPMLIPWPKLNPFSIFTNRPLRNALGYAVDEQEAREKLKIPLTVVTTRYQRDRFVFARYTPKGQDGWDSPLLDHLVASCAIPTIYPPVRINFRGQDELLIDGGVPPDEPFTFTPLYHCQDILTLELVRPEEGEPAPAWNFVRNLDLRGRRTLLRLFAEAVADALSRPDAPRVFRLRPSRVLDPIMVDFRRSHIRRLMALGESDAAAFLAAPDSHLASPQPN